MTADQTSHSQNNPEVKTADEGQQIFTIQEAAVYLGLSTGTISGYVAEKRLTPLPRGPRGRLLFDKHQLDRLKAERHDPRLRASTRKNWTRGSYPRRKKGTG